MCKRGGRDHGLEGMDSKTSKAIWRREYVRDSQPSSTEISIDSLSNPIIIHPHPHQHTWLYITSSNHISSRSERDNKPKIRDGISNRTTSHKDHGDNIPIPRTSLRARSKLNLSREMGRFRRVNPTDGNESTWPVCRQIPRLIIVMFIAALLL